MTEVISKPLYRVLSDLTQESRIEVALPIAIKDWVRLKLKEAREQQEAFEQKHGMSFSSFKEAWEKGSIPDRHSYPVEQDYWEWEAVVTDEKKLQKLNETLL